jgi:hypothetical protein
LVAGRTETLPNIVVLAFHAPLSFLNAYHFRCDVLAALRNAPEPVRLVFWKRARLRGEAQALEPLHLPLPSSGRLMRILRSIVTPSTAFMRFAIPRSLAAAPYERKSSVTSLSGTKPYFFKSLRINLSAARRPIAWSP